MITSITQLFKVILFFLVFLCATFFVGGFGVRRVYAYDVACVSAGIADYMKQVIVNLDARGVIGSNIKLLTPTFNMSEPQFETLFAAFKADPSTVAVQRRLTGTIGNAYNTSGQTVDYWVRRINSSTAGGRIGSEMHLAETGKTPGEPLPIGLIASVTSIPLTSANLFNAFGTNGGWNQFALTKEEIQQVCGGVGNCGNIGVNYAGPFDINSYSKAKDELGLGYVLGIVSGGGDVDGIVRATEKGLIPIIRIGSGDCNSSGAGNFGGAKGAKNYADFIRAVAGRVAADKKVYFIVGPNEPDAERWWSADYGKKTNCGECIGGGGGPAAACVPGAPPFTLTIKGTVKSNRMYLFNGRDPITGTAIYTPYAPGVDSNFPVVKGLPVKGALVQVHNSVKETSADTGNSGAANHPNNSGLLNGMLVGAYKSVKTDADGKFEITATSSCGDIYRSDWKGTGYEQFLSISCSDQPTGRPAGLVLKDSFGTILNLMRGAEGGTINGWEVSVDCGYDPESEYGSFPAKKDLKISNVNRDVYMSCSGQRQDLGNATSHNYDWTQGVQFFDTYTITHDVTDKNRSESEWADWVKRDIRMDVGGSGEFADNRIIPFGYGSDGRNGPQTETRMQIAGQRFSMDQIASLIGFYGGVRGLYVQPTKFYRLPEDVPPGVETYSGSGGEQKPRVATCEEIKRCNTGVSFEKGYQNENAQTCGGTAFNLSSPFAGTVKKWDETLRKEVVDTSRSEYVGRYLRVDKNIEICSPSTKIGEIMPPAGYCGDINGMNGIDGLEMPCPETWSCGDYNGDGDATDEGETECSAVKIQNIHNPAEYINDPENAYKLDSRYFPYFALLSPTPYPIADAEVRRSYSTSDSYASMCPRGINPGQGYKPGEDYNGKSKPMSDSCIYGEGAFTFLTHEEVKFPGYMDYGINYHEALYLSGSKSIDDFSLPFQAIGTPQFTNSVEQSIAGMASTLSASKGANLFRIGVPADLCSCSQVEVTGGGGLRTCNLAGGAEGVPDPLEPSNLMTIARDQGSGAGNYPEWTNEILNPKVEPLATGGDRASQVAGGADWAWKTPESEWSHGGQINGVSQDNVTKGNDTHYTQPITTQAAPEILEGKIDEIVNCSANKRGPIKVWNHDHTDSEERWYMDITCSRLVQHPSTNHNMAPAEWTMPSFSSAAPMTFPEALFPPKIQMTHELGSVVSLEDSYMTKAQRVLPATDRTDMPGNQASGYAIQRGTDYATWTAMLSSLVSAPTPPLVVPPGGGGTGPEPVPPPGPSPSPVPPGPLPTPPQAGIIKERSGGTRTETVGENDPPVDNPATPEDESNPSYTPGAPSLPSGWSVGYVAMSYGAYTDYMGMSQYGAKRWAQVGRNFNEILNFYYKSVGIENMADVPERDSHDTDPEMMVKVAGQPGTGEMSMRDYLYGVSVMPSTWPSEALKAQVIVSRTFAYKFAKDGRVICTSTVMGCPVFNKAKSDAIKNGTGYAGWKSAVDGTSDKVLKRSQQTTYFYSSTTGGYIDDIGWDSSINRITPTWFDQTARNLAHEYQAAAPWFYKGWYSKNYNDSSICDGRTHPYLRPAEMVDILNAYVVWDKGTTEDRAKVLPLNYNKKIGEEEHGCWCTSGNCGIPYSVIDMKRRAEELLQNPNPPTLPKKHAYSRVDLVNMVPTDVVDGRTVTITFVTDQGSVTVDAEKFRTAFNLRAPGYLAIKSRLFKVVKKTP